MLGLNFQSHHVMGVDQKPEPGTLLNGWNQNHQFSGFMRHGALKPGPE